MFPRRCGIATFSASPRLDETSAPETELWEVALNRHPVPATNTPPRFPFEDRPAMVRRLRSAVYFLNRNRGPTPSVSSTSFGIYAASGQQWASAFCQNLHKPVVPRFVRSSEEPARTRNRSSVPSCPPSPPCLDRIVGFRARRPTSSQTYASRRAGSRSFRMVCRTYPSRSRVSQRGRYGLSQDVSLTVVLLPRQVLTIRHRGACRPAKAHPDAVCRRPCNLPGVKRHEGESYLTAQARAVGSASATMSLSTQFLETRRSPTSCPRPILHHALLNAADRLRRPLLRSRCLPASPRPAPLCREMLRRADAPGLCLSATRCHRRGDHRSHLERSRATRRAELATPLPATWCGTTSRDAIPLGIFRGRFANVARDRDPPGANPAATVSPWSAPCREPSACPTDETGHTASRPSTFPTAIRLLHRHKARALIVASRPTRSTSLRVPGPAGKSLSRLHAACFNPEPGGSALSWATTGTGRRDLHEDSHGSSAFGAWSDGGSTRQRPAMAGAAMTRSSIRFPPRQACPSPRLLGLFLLVLDAYLRRFPGGTTRAAPSSRSPSGCFNLLGATRRRMPCS